MKSQTDKHAANLSHIVSALMLTEAKEGYFTDAHKLKDVESLVERASNIYDDILKMARYYQFEPSILTDDEGLFIPVEDS